jgi:hypothetical protein
VWPNAAQVTTCFAPVKVLGSLTISLCVSALLPHACPPYNAWNVQVRECCVFAVFKASSAILAQQGFDVWHFIIPKDYLLPVFAVEIRAVYNYSFFFIFFIFLRFAVVHVCAASENVIKVRYVVFSNILQN